MYNVTHRRRALRHASLAISLLSALALLTPACSDDPGSAGTGGDGGGLPQDSCPEADVTSCDLVVAPSADDTESLQTALIEVSAGGTLCLCPGTYSPKAELSLSVTDVTVRGVGAIRDEVVIDFSAQEVGDNGMSITSDGFTLESLTVRNSVGNAIYVDGASDVTLRDLAVTWDGPLQANNGAYGLYPIQCDNVLIEGCSVSGASDAGIYVGQSSHIVVRDNVAFANVAGIEIENSTDAEVYDNEAFENSAGILVFVLENLTKKDGVRTNVHHNVVRDNNAENVGTGTVGAVPVGTGILVLSADETEVHDNDIRNNGSFGVVVVGCSTLALLGDATCDDEATDDFPERTYVYNNAFQNNGTAIDGVLGALGYDTLPEVVWDGCEANAGGAELCLGNGAQPTFLETGCALFDQAAHSTDPSPFLCEHPAQAPVEP